METYKILSKNSRSLTDGNGRYIIMIVLIIAIVRAQEQR